MTPVERAARAMYEVWRHHKLAPKLYADITWDDLLRWAAEDKVAAKLFVECGYEEARAAIASLRKPTPAIVHAICNSIAEDGACLRCPAEIQPYPDVAPEKRGMPGCYHHARETLRRGIDAALSDCSDDGRSDP